MTVSRAYTAGCWPPPEEVLPLSFLMRLIRASAHAGILEN